MKKLILICALVASAITSQAATHFTTRMLTGAFTCISNGTTLSYNTSNVWYYSYSAGTNVYGGSTNAGGFTIPGPLTQAPLVPNLNGDINNNLALQVIVGSTNNLFRPSGMSPVVGNLTWTNPTPFLPFFTNALAQTNTLVITLSKVGSRQFGVPDANSTNSTLSCTILVTNGIVGAITMPINTGFLQGAGAISASISATAAGSGNLGVGPIVNAINLVGWTP